MTARDEAIEAAHKRLSLIHWDGTGCGTNGTSGCVYCFGPSPLGSYEVSRVVLAAAVPVLLTDLADRIEGIPLKSEQSGGLASAGGMRICASAAVRAAAEGWGA